MPKDIKKANILFRRIGKIAKTDYQLRYTRQSPCVSVRPHGTTLLQWTDFQYFEKNLLKKIQV
jgi:hypothetical protein